jgi:hypothetical protein
VLLSKPKYISNVLLVAHTLQKVALEPNFINKDLIKILTR